MTSVKPSGFIDIHSHILPFLDDGTENFEQCLTSARHYLKAGFDKVIATPHFVPGTKWELKPEQILETIQQVEKLLDEHEVPLQILPGMEIMLTDIMCSDFNPDQFLALGGGKSYLIEFPFNTPLSTLLTKELQRLQSLEGVRFVIAHPERCRIFHDNSNWLESFVDQGMLTQVNIDSLLGHAGGKVQQKAFEFLDAGLVHFLASDTHGHDGRMPPEDATIKHLYELLGKETTNHALKLNPQWLLAGKRVDPLIPDGNIKISASLNPQRGSYIQKLKNIFTHN